jgi:hypothetical protein
MNLLLSAFLLKNMKQICLLALIQSCFSLKFVVKKFANVCCVVC